MAVVLADDADDGLFYLRLGCAGALFLDKIAAVKLHHLKIAVVQAFQEGGELGVAIISHIKIREALGEEVSHLGQDDGLVLAVVLDEQLGDGLLYLVRAGDGLCDLVDGGCIFLEGRAVRPAP